MRNGLYDPVGRQILACQKGGFYRSPTGSEAPCRAVYAQFPAYPGAATHVGRIGARMVVSVTLALTFEGIVFALVRKWPTRAKRPLLEWSSYAVFVVAVLIHALQPRLARQERREGAALAGRSPT